MSPFLCCLCSNVLHKQRRKKISKERLPYNASLELGHICSGCWGGELQTYEYYILHSCLDLSLHVGREDNRPPVTLQFNFGRLVSTASQSQAIGLSTAAAPLLSFCLSPFLERNVNCLDLTESEKVDSRQTYS